MKVFQCDKRPFVCVLVRCSMGVVSSPLPVRMRAGSMHATLYRLQAAW